MKVGSLFSGIEGFGLGFEKAGCEIAWQVESEPFCLAVLKTHWPAVQRFTDIRGVGKANLAKVDCITAGVPCQDVSVAGRRKGLAGERTGLFFEFARILCELRPHWFVFENVPGLFSSNKGRDFAEVLRVLMVECGYGVSWRVLDSRYFNVAQRRERVFIVGCFGKPCPTEILFESPGSERNPSQSRTPQQDIAVPLTSGSGITGNDPGRRREDDINLVAAPIGCGLAKLRHDQDGYPEHLVAATLRESDGHHGRSSPRGDGCDNIVLGRGADNGHARLLNAGKGPDDAGETAFSLRSDPGGIGQGHNTTFAIAENQRGEIRTSAIAPQLSTGGGKPGSGYSAVAYKETCGTLHSGHQQGGWCHNGEEAAEGMLVGAAPDSNGVRNFASLPKGMDSPRYRALGNAVTATVAEWIAERIVTYASAHDSVE